ncbi:MAG: 16S rRNA processing protein RimM [Myxococcales bacterium FL481]|nr:MAG: 16S rRNA processing protein RimM [Myxococcales bacterium FL481]
MSSLDAESIEVGIVVGAHGVGGALRVRLHDIASDALATKRVVTLCDANGHGLTCELRRVSRQPGTQIVRIWVDGVSSRDDAERWRRAAVRVDRAQLTLREDEYYLADLIGLRVRGHVDSAEGAGRLLGRVSDLTSNGVQDLLQIDADTGEGRVQWLLPALSEFIIAFDEHEVVVDVPPGFLPRPIESDWV